MGSNNAYELADYLDNNVEAMLFTEQPHLDNAANMLRQQADRIAELEKFVGDLKNITDVQGQKGCWDIDNYMTGLFNGLEMSLSIFEQREPQFKDTTPQTKPLSNDEILEMTIWNKNLYELYVEMEKEDMIAFARAIEERHGIK